MTTDPRYGAETGSVASDPTSSRSDEARDRAQDVKGTARAEARGVQDSAKQQAGRVGREAQAQARDLVGQAQQQLRGQAEDQTGRLAVSLRSVGNNLQALTEGRPEEAGAVGDYAKEAMQRVQSWADRLDERGLDGLLSDVQRFARRRPGAFLLSAAAAGFVVGRVARGARDAGTDDRSDEFTQLDPYVPPAVTTRPERVEVDVVAVPETQEVGWGQPGPPVTGPGGTRTMPDVSDQPVTRDNPSERF